MNAVGVNAACQPRVLFPMLPMHLHSALLMRSGGALRGSLPAHIAGARCNREAGGWTKLKAGLHRVSQSKLHGFSLVGMLSFRLRPCIACFSLTGLTLTAVHGDALLCASALLATGFTCARTQWRTVPEQA